MLYKYLNITNQSLSRVERHACFVYPIKPFDCSLVNDLPEKQRCSFFSNQEFCKHGGVVSYLQFYYCNFSTNERFSTCLGVLLLSFVLCYYFWLFGLVAKIYFCPALQAVTKILHLNENIAGVTILAMGNTAPDVFTTIASLHSTTRLEFADTIASNFFTVTFLSSVIILVKPFAVDPGFFLRDISFLLLVSIYADHMIKTTDKITTMRALGIPFLYLCYIIVVFIDHWLLSRQQRMVVEKQSSIYMMATSQIENTNKIAKTTNDSGEAGEPDIPKVTLFKQFYNDIRPFKCATFREYSHVFKIVAILKIPLALGLRLLIPYVNYDAYNLGWSKLLFCLQIVIVPLTLLYFTIGFQNVLITLIVLFLSVLIALVVFLETRTDPPPRCYKFAAFLSTIISTIVFYAIAVQLLLMLEAMGIALHCSDALVGSTLLAYGNSMGDLFANIVMAKQGLPRMAFAACFGSPIFNTLCSIGIPCVYHTLRSGVGFRTTTEGTLGENNYIFMIIALFAILLYALTTNFMMRRSGAVVNLVIYAIYFVGLLLTEFEIIHAFGSDHTLDGKFETSPIDNYLRSIA